MNATWYRWDDMEREVLHDKLSRRIITGDQMMLAHVYLKQGCVVPKHSHMNEQLTYVLEGALKFFVGDDREEILHSGDACRGSRHTFNRLFLGGGAYAPV